MKKVYLEHSYLAKEENWPKIIHFFEKNPTFKPVVSDWNMVEIAQAKDMQQAKRRVDFIESINPLWIINKIYIQKREVESFLYRKLYGHMIWPYTVFVSNFHDSTLLSISQQPMGKRNLLGFVTAYIKHPENLEPVKAEQQRYLETYEKLKAVGEKKIREQEHITFPHWIKDVLPDRKPDGTPLNEDEKRRALNFCVKNKEAFFSYCPYFRFEDNLFSARFSDPHRKPRMSDAMDLEHICCSVPYCDFVVAEKYLKHISSIANKDLKMGKVVSRISEINA